MEKKKFVKLSISILLVLCIILIIVMKIFSKYDVNKKNKIQEEHAKKYLEEVLIPRNIMILYSYKGQLDRNVLYKSIRTFSNYISDINAELNNCSDEQFQQYYENNKWEIRDYLGIQEKFKFVNFMNYLKDKDVNANELRYAEIEKGSEYTKFSYFWFTLNIYYGEQDNPTCVPFKAGFAEMENALIKVKYDMSE